MRRVRRAGLAVAVVATVGVVGGSVGAPALASPGGDSAGGPAPTGVVAADTLSADMLSAAQRDLGLTADQARARFARDAAAGRSVAALRARLGERYAGGWVAGDADRPVVAVTDAAAADTVRAAGAEPRVVGRSERRLTESKARLDAAADRAPSGVHGWFVDVTTNRVVVAADTATQAAAVAFAARAGAEAEVVLSTDAPTLRHDVRGGDPYYPNDSPGHCSIGFAVEGGFVTAGHCGGTGDSTTGFNRVAQGTFAGSSFPENDYAWVRTNSDWTPLGVVYNYSGGTVAVAGATQAPVGAAICRSGFTSQWRCGVVDALDVTVNYAEGTVRGLTRTTACSQSGDSGGSFIAGDQAQGVLSGGSGACSTTTGRSFFQPLPEILQVYGLTLITSGGGGTGCEGYPNSYSGRLTGSGNSQIQPNGSYYYRAANVAHRGCLRGPSGANFNLQLQRWSGASWRTVARAEGPTSAETLTHSGSAGYYRYRVVSASGSGDYTLSTE
jgi:streptogrisin C